MTDPPAADDALRAQESRMRMRHRTQLLWTLVGVCVVASALIWALWVVPVSQSVAAAQPVPLGQRVELPTEGVTGVWASGAAPLLGLVECRAETADGSSLGTWSVPSPGWDDTLWWMTHGGGFSPVLSIADAGGAAASVTCTSRIDTYDGEFLLAGDVTAGGGGVGLGRMGNVDYRTGTLLALGAVGLPLFALLMTIVLLVQGVRSRRAAR
ncbi:hypothetical protein [Microbacterium sp. SORGH_AS_0862]|uniref:hypothetical protein n=1 Tax=Microbacterium sp. SORGH_AS_0862 TaxID=3041789 RepID=UPI002793BC0F|nr:hypothetical protein [Microbacterium sp. SORGH_AS_0862]MDQ1204520.1 hypothetical protein [Microbacterium sp. SORGH_AS_0862]